MLRHLADLVYNLFAPTQDANINASLVLDQLEGTLNRQCSTINEHEEHLEGILNRKCSTINEHEELLDLDTMGTKSDKIRSEDSDSTNSYKQDNLSIQSLDIFSLTDTKKQVKLPTSKTSGSLKDLRTVDSDSDNQSSKPDLIHIKELRKAFWSRRNRFHLKRFGFLKKKHGSSADANNPGSDPKLGAIVSLAALAAGMTSFPIVHQHQDQKETQETLDEKKEDITNLDQDTKTVLEQPKILEEKAKTPVEEELEISMLCSKLEHEMHELEKLEQEVEQAELKNQIFYHPDLMTTINRSKSMQIHNEDDTNQSKLMQHPKNDTNRSKLMQNPKNDTNRPKCQNSSEQNQDSNQLQKSLPESSVEVQNDAKKAGFKIPPRLQRQKSMPSIDSLVMFTEGSETWL